MSKVIYKKSKSSNKVSYSYKENTVNVDLGEVRSVERFFENNGFFIKNSRRKKMKKPTIVNVKNLI